MRRIILVLMGALVIAGMMVITVPAVAQPGPASVALVIQQDKEKDKTDEKAKTDEKEKEKEKEALPKSGGIPVADIALLGMGAAVLLVGAGLLVRKVVG